jgi:UDP-glucose 4-epimerase
MKYFITGGSGFIGSTCTDRLIQQEHIVTVYDNLSSGKIEFLQKHFDNPRFKFVQGDTLDLPKLGEALAGHDAVVHFAANPDIARGMKEPDLDLRQSIIATFNVLEAMRHNKVNQFIYPSGSGVYGDVGLTETTEEFGPLLPISMYGAGKLGAEGVISAMCHMFDMQAWIFRFANVVGKRQTHGVAFDFIRRLKNDSTTLEILGDGTQSKSYIHVDDVLDAVFFAREKTSGRVNLFNVATADYLSVREIADLVVEEMGLRNVQYRFFGGDRGWKGDVPKVRFNLDLIHNLGWYAKKTSREAMRQSIREML